MVETTDSSMSRLLLVEDERALANEAADLLYHLLVLLEARGVDWEEVIAVLEGRMGPSGLVEKASRAKQGEGGMS